MNKRVIIVAAVLAVVGPVVAAVVGFGSSSWSLSERWAVAQMAGGAGLVLVLMIHQAAKDYRRWRDRTQRG